MEATHSDDTPDPGRFASPSGALKRPRNNDKWKVNLNKRARNLGLPYKSKNTGIINAERKIGHPCTCKKRCFEKVGQENIELIFSQFWKLGDYNLQCSFIQAHSEAFAVRRHRPRTSTKVQKTITNKYHVLANNVKIPVCFQALSSILGIPKATLSRMVLKKNAHGVLISDMRGRHNNHYRIPEEAQQLVISHIESIPTVTSHYSRVKNPNALYIDGDIKSKSELYKLYVEWMASNHPGKYIVKFHYYDDIMKSKFKQLHIEKPKVDTCNKCDSFKLNLKETDSDEEKRRIEIDRNIHWNQAQKGYELVKGLKGKFIIKIKLFIIYDINY